MRFRRRLKYPCIRARGSCIRRMAVSMQNTIKKKQKQKITITRPCEQGNWDTWMVLDPWNQL